MCYSYMKFRHRQWIKFCVNMSIYLDQIKPNINHFLYYDRDLKLISSIFHAKATAVRISSHQRAINGCVFSLSLCLLVIEAHKEQSQNVKSPVDADT